MTDILIDPPVSSPSDPAPLSPGAIKQSKAIDESVVESFPASDPPASHLPDIPPSNADAKWAAAKAAAAEQDDPAGNN